MPSNSNFENDLKIEIQLKFSELGLKIPIRNKLKDMLLDYLTIHKKLVKIKQRDVLINPELEKKLNNHPKSKEVENLKILLSSGKNVNFFQSKKLFQTKFHDHLLYEWNVYHFHLSNQFDKKTGFVKQSNDLLFIYIEEDKAILLDIAKHTVGIFADTKWLEILDNHFPDVLEPYKAEDIFDVYPEVNAEERQLLWDKGYLLGMTKVNNKVYRSKGIGRASSGHSILVTKTAIGILRWIHKLESHFQTKKDEIANEFNFDKNKVEYKIRFGDVTLEVIEKRSNTILLTYPYLFKFND